MKLKIEQAIEMARKNESLEGVVIEDLKETQVRTADALILAEYGIVVPEQNIYYSDEGIAYDPDFDEVEWNEEPLNMTWEEKVLLAKEIENNNKKEEEVSIKVNISDREVRQWVTKNYDKMGQILGNFIVDIYKANKIIKE